MESHLRSDVIFHVDLACAKLKNTEVKLHQTEAKLKDTELKLNETQKNLEVTRKRVEELDTRVFIWKINDFSEVLRQAKTEGKNKIESVPFYVAKPESYGYKLKVKLYPNGSGSDKNTHLSVFINVMKGEYDVILPWPLSKKVKFTLIDQQEDPAQWENVARELISQKFPHIFSRPTTEENKGRGFPDFISHETLYLRRYLVDDSLFLQVELAPSSD